MALYLGNKFLTNSVKFVKASSNDWEKKYLDYLDGYLVIPAETTSIRDNAFKANIYLLTVSFENDSQCTTIGKQSFNGCDSLKEVTIPNSVTSIGSSCFGSCRKLETITINKPENSIEGAPWGATNATVIWNG